jgi:hypothetical protein
LILIHSILKYKICDVSVDSGVGHYDVINEHEHRMKTFTMKWDTLKEMGSEIKHTLFVQASFLITVRDI